MGNRKARRKKNSQEAQSKPEGSGAARGWISPRTGIFIIAVVALLNAANVLYAFSRSANLTATAAFTFLALATPVVAAGLVYFIRRKLAG